MAWCPFGHRGLIHLEIDTSLQGFTNLASDWLAAMLPANQKPGLKILDNMEFILSIVLDI